MLLLFETSAGYALFKVMDNKVLDKPDKIWSKFEDPSSASTLMKLKKFEPFENTTDAVVAATSIVDGTLDKSLKSFLNKNIVKKEIKDDLIVAESKLGGLIKEKINLVL